MKAYEYFEKQFGKEQKNMTRDEALEKIRNAPGTTLNERITFLNCAEALGLIKFDEPKSVEQKAIDAMFKHTSYGGLITPQHAVEVIQNAGLKIVEK